MTNPDIGFNVSTIVMTSIFTPKEKVKIDVTIIVLTKTTKEKIKSSYPQRCINLVQRQYECT